MRRLRKLFMKTNLWSMKTGLPLFAIVVVAVVLFEHVRRGVEYDPC